MPTQTITPEELKAWLDERRTFVLLDTGLAEEFAAQHLPDARNACVFEVNFLDQVRSVRGLETGGLGQPTPIVVYGASQRSLASTAAGKLAAAGFSALFDGQHHGTLALLLGGTHTLGDGRAVAGGFSLDMTGIRDTDLADSLLRQVLHDHLASDDSFDVARYPQAVFQLEGADEIAGITQGEANYHVRGKFVLKGVTNPLTFPAMISHSPDGDGSLVARANFDLDRTRWNVLYGSGKFYEKLGRHLVSDLITIDLKIAAR